jgi:hypothetical protein
VHGNRGLRYRCIDRHRLWLGHRVAAVILTPLINLGPNSGTMCLDARTGQAS